MAELTSPKVLIFVAPILCPQCVEKQPNTVDEGSWFLLMIRAILICACQNIHVTNVGRVALYTSTELVVAILVGLTLTWFTWVKTELYITLQ